MKHFIQKKSLLYAGLLAFGIITTAHAADCPPSNECPIIPMLSIRSQGRNSVHQMVESVGHVHRPDEQQGYSSLSALLGYEKSFRPNKITECFFGSALLRKKKCATNQIKIQGSSFLGENRDPKALLADYFYLPIDFESTVSFEPVIKNIVTDFDYYCDLSDYCSGLYFRVHGPIVHTAWHMNMCENVTQTGTLGYPNGYFTPGEFERDKLLLGFKEYAHGCMPCPITQDSLLAPLTIIEDNIPLITAGTVVPFSPPISTKFQGLKYGQINDSSCYSKNTGIAEVRVELGRRFIDQEDYHLGLDLQFAIPTGPKKKSRLLFEPQIGNGQHWELGAGVHGHWNFRKNEEENSVTSFHFNANVTHLFNAHQIRTFDLKNRPLSRYALAMKFTPAVSSKLQVFNPIPIGQFAGEFAPVANITTLNVNVSARIQADIVAMVNYTKNNWSFDVGYNFWGRSCEDIKCRTTCCPNLNSVCDPSQENRWAIKGDARVYGYTSLADSPASPALDPVALSATQNCATIHEGNNQTVLNFLTTDVNRNVDNPAVAPVSANETMNISNGSGVPITTLNPGFHIYRINTSIQPILIECDDIDIVSSRGISNKVFAHLSHTNDYDTWNLHYGIGGSAEFGLTDECCTSTCATRCKKECDSSCINCAISQWSVWGKVGIDFN